MKGWLAAIRHFLIKLFHHSPGSLVTVFTVRLESSQPGAYFLASIETVWPESESTSPQTQAIIQQQLLTAAKQGAGRHSVLDHDEALCAINLELGRHLSLSESHVHLLRASVKALWSDKADRDLTEQCAALCRETELARAEQEEKTRRLIMLGTHVLADPVLARLWWLDNQPDRLEELTKSNLMFEQTTALFSKATEDRTTEPVIGLIQTFVQDLTVGQRELLIGQLEMVFRSYEHDNLADQLPARRITPATPVRSQPRPSDAFNGQDPA